MRETAWAVVLPKYEGSWTIELAGRELGEGSRTEGSIHGYGDGWAARLRTLDLHPDAVLIDWSRSGHAAFDVQRYPMPNWWVPRGHVDRFSLLYPREYEPVDSFEGLRSLDYVNVFDWIEIARGLGAHVEPLAEALARCGNS